MSQEISIIKAFIIHLERARAREVQVRKLVASVPVCVEIVQAIDVKDLSLEDIARYYQPRLYKPSYPFALSTNEIACFLSHRKIWAEIVAQNCAGGLILEDDAEIGNAFATAFALSSEFITEYGLIRFPHKMREKGQILVRREGVELIKPLPVGLGQVAYLISREVAQKLLVVTERFDRPIDVLLQMFWLTKVRPLSILPSGIKEISAQIGGSTLHKRCSFGEKWHREILRPLYRWRVKNFSKEYA